MKTTFHRITRSIASLALLASLAACASMQAPRSGFLGSYGRLAYSEDRSTGSARTAAPVDPGRSTIAEVQWRVPADAGISADDQAQLRTRLRDELQQQMKHLPALPGGRPVTVRAAITRVEPVSPALNTALTLLVFLPLDRGGAAIEIEAIDGNTGEQIAALTQGYYAPMSELGARFSKLAAAELALKKAAEAFVPLLQ